METDVDFIDVEFIWVKIFAPLNIILVFWMIRIFYCLKKIIIAINSPYIFRWARSLAFQNNRIFLAILRNLNAFKYKVVLPTVAKIIFVNHSIFRFP